MLGTGLVTAHLKLLRRALLQKNGNTQSNSTHFLLQMVCSDYFNSSVSVAILILYTGTTVADNCTGVDQVRTSQSTKHEACQSMLMYCRILIVTVLQWIVLSSTRARGASTETALASVNLWNDATLDHQKTASLLLGYDK